MKISRIGIAAVIMLSFSMIPAQQAQGRGSMGGGMRGMGGMMMGDSGQMCSMMMHFGIRQVVATQDGGIVVVSGNKLMKYDSGLNLKKEVEVKIDTTGMANFYSMMSKCPMIWRGDTTGTAKPKK